MKFIVESPQQQFIDVAKVIARFSDDLKADERGGDFELPSFAGTGAQVAATLVWQGQDELFELREFVRRMLFLIVRSHRVTTVSSLPRPAANGSGSDR
jgi:hypothetical protein